MAARGVALWHNSRMLRANVRVLSTALFSALGLAPLACGGGTFSSSDGDAGSSAGGSASGANATGGAATAGSGGNKSTGGSKSTGGVSSGGMSSGGMSSGGGGSNPFPCNDPTVIGAGYEQCGDNGRIHRPMIAQCASKLPREAAKVAPPGDGQCAADTDCADMPHGYCNPNGGGQIAGAYCAYGCIKDAECPAGNICVCGDPVGHCAPAACTSDAGCGSGLLCQSYDPSGGCGAQAFACQTPGDSCASAADCMAGICAPNATGSFSCSPGGCVVGRPFLVEGEARVATVTTRADWLQTLELELDGVAAGVRQSAAQAWARIGQMEHASVAAFARFALQLLSLGAPPRFVELTTQAMADETRHARLAFGLASVLGASSLGPAALDVSHSLLETELGDVVRLVIREGCIGETCAALEAREAAELAEQPELRRLLHGVADDETRHAELAWRFVSWALEREPELITGIVQSELDRAASQIGSDAASPAPATPKELAVSAWGVLPEQLRREVQNTAIREVIRPAAAALLRRIAGEVPENLVLSA